MTGDAGQGSRIQLRVRYAETDQMGRAHHMQFLAWFELGRTELIRATGTAYSELERRGVRLPVTEVHVRYLEGAGYDELVEIETCVSELRSRSVTFSYRARRSEGGALLASGSTKLVCTDAVGRPMRMPADVARTLGRLVGSTSEAVAG